MPPSHGSPIRERANSDFQTKSERQVNTHTFVVADRNYRMEPTARLLQVLAVIHGAKLKHDGINVMGVAIHEVAGLRLEIQTDVGPKKAEEHIANALKGLGFVLRE